MSFFRYVEFDKFMLNELGEAIGVNGYIWPTKKRVSCKINIEDLTLLRFSLDKGFESVSRVFLKKK